MLQGRLQADERSGVSNGGCGEEEEEEEEEEEVVVSTAAQPVSDEHSNVKLER